MEHGGHQPHHSDHQQKRPARNDPPKERKVDDVRRVVAERCEGDEHKRNDLNQTTIWHY